LLPSTIGIVRGREKREGTLKDEWTGSNIGGEGNLRKGND